MENSEFFNTASEQKSKGYNWEYVGKNNREILVPALPIIIKETNEEIIYYKLKK